jgi:selenocysteine lyase/cysteine desulfurase
MKLEEFRAQFPALKTRAYLFSGAMTPAAATVRTEWDKWTDAWSADPNSVYTEEAMLGGMTSSRQAFATLLNATPQEIALTDSTSRAANIAIRILANRGSGGVVVDESTYPSSVYPWHAQGRDVHVVTTAHSADPSATLTEAITDDTIAVCVSHVSPFTGRRHNLALLSAAAHDHGALLMVDAAQSTGVVPLDTRAEGIDLLVTTGMKWLLGPPGIGYLYATEEVLATAPVLDVGYIGLDVPLGEWPVAELPPVSPTARRYELGLPSLPALGASRAGIQLLLQVGIANISAHVEHLMTRCLDGLQELCLDVTTPRDPARRAGVLVFTHKYAAQLFEACRHEGVDIGMLTRGRLRVDPHGFNNEADIDRFLEACRTFDPNAD